MGDVKGTIGLYECRKFSKMWKLTESHELIGLWKLARSREGKIYRGLELMGSFCGGDAQKRKLIGVR